MQQSNPLRYKRLHHPEYGIYLLEVSVISFALAFLLVGAFDISKLLQARGAVRAGVEEGLRCLYTSDSACTSKKSLSLSLTLPSRDDVWLTNPFLVKTDLFRANAGWHTQPVNEVAREKVLISTIQTKTGPGNAIHEELQFRGIGHSVLFS